VLIFHRENSLAFVRAASRPWEVRQQMAPGTRRSVLLLDEFPAPQGKKIKLFSSPEVDAGEIEAVESCKMDEID
jgi:hypothetical protein